MRRVAAEQSLTSENRDLIARFLGHLDNQVRVLCQNVVVRALVLAESVYNRFAGTSLQVFAGLGVCALHDLYTKKSETIAKSNISTVMSVCS